MAPAQPEAHRFTVDDYYRMADAGILNEDSRVELLRGEVVGMAPIGSHHAAGLESPLVSPTLLCPSEQICSMF